MKKYIVVGCFVLLSLFLFFFFFNPFPTSLPTISKKQPVSLLVIPLDNRPVNTYVPNELAQTTGTNLLIPPDSLLGDLTTSGDRKRLQTWIMTHAKKADGFILSADMLTYGGLVSSRTLSVSEKQAKRNLSFFTHLHKHYPNKPVYAYTSILRLAPTATSNKDLTTYQQVRRWAELSYEINFLHDSSHQKEWDHLNRTIPSDVLHTYQQTRLRNFHVNQTLLSYVQKGIIDYLLIGKDDASQIGLHQAEQKQLEQLIKEKKLTSHVAFFSGIDEAGSVMVSRFLTHHYQIQPSVYVWYNSPFARFWHAPFEDDTLAENIKKHIKTSGGNLTYNPWKADIQLVVNAPFPSFLEPLFSRWIDYHLWTGKQMILADVASVNQADSAFVSSLLSTPHLTELLSYSGWGTSGNSLGLSISHGFTRYIYLTTSEHYTFSQQQIYTQHHLSLLYRSFLIDYGYHSHIYPILKQNVVAEKGDPLQLKGQEPVITHALNQQIHNTSTAIFTQGFKGKNVPLSHQQTMKISQVESLHASFPWHRLFEIEIKPHVTIEKKH